jgi:hypothetical protein
MNLLLFIVIVKILLKFLFQLMFNFIFHFTMFIINECSFNGNLNFLLIIKAYFTYLFPELFIFKTKN